MPFVLYKAEKLCKLHNNERNKYKSERYEIELPFEKHEPEDISERSEEHERYKSR